MREYHILNLGAGGQSTCLFLLAREPDANLGFDVAIFADTGEEPAAVYRHLDYLKSLGQPEIWVRSAGKLGDDLIHGVNSTGQQFASIPAFTAGDHLLRPRPCENRLPPAPQYGMVRRQCTSEYKIRVIERAIRREVVGLKPWQRMPKDVRVGGVSPGPPSLSPGGTASGGDAVIPSPRLPPLDDTERDRLNSSMPHWLDYRRLCVDSDQQRRN